MNKLAFICPIVVCTLILFQSCSEDDSSNIEPWIQEVELLKTAMTSYSEFNNAKTAGYDVDVTGYVPQMGYHYLNATLMDNNFELEKPEILQYALDDKGILQFVGVEYAIPVQNINNPPPPPEGFSGSEDEWDLNTDVGLWTLHVWVGMDNPNGIFIASNASLTHEDWVLEIEQLKTATTNFKEFDKAEAAGYDVDVTGYVPQMGHHFLNASLMDENFELEKPEILQFVPDGNGTMQLIAVEYAIPVQDINNPPPAPEGFTGNVDEWDFNADFGLWTLHVWIGNENPNGIFSDFNSNIP